MGARNISDGLRLVTQQWHGQVPLLQPRGHSRLSLHDGATAPPLLDGPAGQAPGLGLHVLGVSGFHPAPASYRLGTRCCPSPSRSKLHFPAWLFSPRPFSQSLTRPSPLRGVLACPTLGPHAAPALSVPAAPLTPVSAASSRAPWARGTGALGGVPARGGGAVGRAPPPS